MTTDTETLFKNSAIITSGGWYPDKIKILLLLRMALDRLRALVWGEKVDEDIFLRWAQGFVFSSVESLALVQHSGGPCAILTAVQGFILQKRLFQTEANTSFDSDSWRECSETEAYGLLVEALVHILGQADTSGLSVAFLEEKGLNAIQLPRQKPKSDESASRDPNNGHAAQLQTDPARPTSTGVEKTGADSQAATTSCSPLQSDTNSSQIAFPHLPQSSLTELAPAPCLGSVDNTVLPPAAVDDFLRVVSQSHYAGGTLAGSHSEPHTFTMDSIGSTLQNIAEMNDGTKREGQPSVPDSSCGDVLTSSLEGKKPEPEGPPAAGGVVLDMNVAGVIEQFHKHIRVVTLKTRLDVQQFLHQNISDLKGPFGILLFLYSLLLTKGIQELCSEMEDVQDPLIHGVHGFGSQNLINLLLVGRAVTNVFDHEKDIEGIKLRGITKQASIGFLTLLEAFRYCEVGSFLKDPVYPIWVTGSETHLTLTFSSENLLASPEDSVSIAKKEFGKFDQEGNGFIPTNMLHSLLTALGLETDPEYVSYMIRKLDTESLGMILLDNFLREFCPNMSEESASPLAFPIYHYNGLVQSARDGKVSFSKGVAIVLSERTGLSDAGTLLNCLHTKWPGLVVNWEGEEPKIN